MTDPATLRPSPICAAFIKGFEKCRLKSYLPTPNDVPTIGWGATGPDVKLGIMWTQDQCDARFERDLADFGAEVRHALGTSPTSQGQYDAMTSLAYNIGVSAFCKSTLLRLHKAGDFAGAADQFARWNRQSGAVLAGLTRRREAERTIYLSH